MPPAPLKVGPPTPLGGIINYSELTPFRGAGGQKGMELHGLAETL